MASTTITDYQVLTDGSFNLGGNTTTKSLNNFEIPSDFSFEAGVRKPILAFKILPFEDSTIKVRVNEREVASFNLDKSHTRAYYEPFSAKTAFPEGASFNNPTSVKFFLASGKVRISDVIIWYQIRRNG